MIIEKVALDRKDMKIRKCWWMNKCSHPYTLRFPSGNSILPKGNYVIEVSEDEARNGKGRKCPICGRLTGSYVCDGFPHAQGSVVFSET